MRIPMIQAGHSTRPEPMSGSCAVPLVARRAATLAMAGEVRKMPHGRYTAVTEPV
jgi:hypothetical protein